MRPATSDARWEPLIPTPKKKKTYCLVLLTKNKMLVI